jgi:hypothetical protein
MNVFYTSGAKWEIDFFKNDIFNNSLYKFKINFILFNNNNNIKINNNIENNIIIVNDGVPYNFVENMIKKLKPLVIFHLSDEFGRNNKYYNLYSKYNIKLLFHNYNFKRITDYVFNRITDYIFKRFG